MTRGCCHVCQENVTPKYIFKSLSVWRRLGMLGPGGSTFSQHMLLQMESNLSSCQDRVMPAGSKLHVSITNTAAQLSCTCEHDMYCFSAAKGEGNKVRLSNPHSSGWSNKLGVDRRLYQSQLLQSAHKMQQQH